jgi:hypothetical protein
MIRALSPMALLFVLAACSSSSSPGSTTDAGGKDATVEGGGGGDDGGSPSPPGTCLPNPGSSGNAKHVGAYCTPGGGECNKWGSGNASICAIDVDPQGDKFCILIGCKTNDDCADKACCTGRADEPVHACVPLGCVDNGSGQCTAIPGQDAGSDSGGASDAADQ